jgi:hypothetical protein
MKKLIYILLFAFATSLTVSSCTEEEVTPTHELRKASGGNGSDPL